MALTRRKLPHLLVPGHPTFVTFRLVSSLPKNRPFFSTVMSSGKAFDVMDRLLEQNPESPRYLASDQIAETVTAHLIGLAQSDTDLHTWVIMPNHVHLLLTTWQPLGALMGRLKGATAHAVNQILGRPGPLWQNESYDRLVRNRQEYNQIERYILNNPVRAGLGTSVTEYRWSSAFTGERRAEMVPRLNDTGPNAGGSARS